MVIDRERRLQMTAKTESRPVVPAHGRNPGISLELEIVKATRVNTSAVERRAHTIAARRSVKKEWQAAWLLKAVSCIDLTALSGDDTRGNITRLCAKARRPVRMDILQGFEVEDLGITVGAVCVFHNLIEYAVEALEGSGIPVAGVSTGFPAGQTPRALKIREIKTSVNAGAEEIDVVISRSHVLRGEWRKLYDEVAAYRDACGDAHLKTILATGELGTLRNVARASHVCMMAGADFIKTSTGKEPVNATLPVSLVMIRAIRDYFDLTGHIVGFKPAGGIRSAKQALAWLALMKEELGNRWLSPTLFRFGASSLLSDIERQLEHTLTGRYSAYNRHPLS